MSKQLQQGFFSVDGLRQFFLNAKEFPETLFYGAMAKNSWYVWLGASPLLLILLPLIGLSLAGMAALDIYNLVKAANKNMDKWLGAIFASLSTVLAGVSISSLVLGTIFNFTWAAGPWFFLSSVLAFSSYNLFNMGITLMRILESPQGSPQRMHFLQQMVAQLNMCLTAAMVIGSVLIVVLFPGSPVLAAVFAGGSALMTLVNISWRFMPESMKASLKSFFGFTKPDIEVVDSNVDTQQRSPGTGLAVGEVQGEKIFQMPANTKGSRFFTAPDYYHQLRGIDDCNKLSFMEQALINYSQQQLQHAEAPVRVVSKRACVEQMLSNIADMRCGKAATPLVMDDWKELSQSFFRESEMEALLKAYSYLESVYNRGDIQSLPVSGCAF